MEAFGISETHIRGLEVFESKGMENIYKQARSL